MLCALSAPEDETAPQAVNCGEELQRGDTLFATGQTLKKLYVIRSGSIKTSITGSDGQSQITGFHLRGALLGLDGIESGEYSHSALALENSQLCSMSYSQFSLRIATKPHLLNQLLGRISHDIKVGNRMTFTLGRCNAQQRLARFLLDLSDSYRRSGLAVDRLSLPMSRSDIASYLGLASETTCRVLQRFHAMGLIIVERRDITLKNTSQLRKIADDFEIARGLLGLVHDTNHCLRNTNANSTVVSPVGSTSSR